jgi:hypothetical protein
MIDARRVQRTFGDGFVAESVADLQEAWMRPEPEGQSTRLRLGCS